MSDSSGVPLSCSVAKDDDFSASAARSKAWPSLDGESWQIINNLGHHQTEWWVLFFAVFSVCGKFWDVLKVDGFFGGVWTERW